ncbi:MAG: hypothetical protein LBP24_01005 [Coriobacteriales bacterium]|jgi:hypothetical protein|nr:hypothetical protein [Coriobacteriales bacterium]
MYTEQAKHKPIKSRAYAAFSAAALALITAGLLLVGCGGIGGASDIVAIETSRMMVNDSIEMTNYQAVLKQTPTEWNALSAEDKEELARIGFDQILERIAADGTSNFSIRGATSAGTDAAGNPTEPQQAFFLNTEESVLLIYTGTDGSTAPEITAQVAVELPLS